MRRIISAFGKPNWEKRAYAVLALCVSAPIALHAQTFTTLYSFAGTDGAFPAAGLIQATTGDLYGTTLDGGTPGTSTLGTVFKVTPDGNLTTLYRFCSQTNCADGVGIDAGLVQGTNGYLYGTTSSGGANVSSIASTGAGTVFKISLSGTLTTLYSFCAQSGCTDGEFPEAGLIQATNGDFYGQTGSGGTANLGTVFRITPTGKLTTLHSFCSNFQQGYCADGSSPWGNLMQATNGYLYGTTYYGGTGGGGTVYKISPGGALTTLYSFCSQSGCADGRFPLAGLIQATNGYLYGTTSSGGTNGAGTVFKISPGGTLTTLYSFCSQSNCADGGGPEAPLIQATNGYLYGTTADYGAYNSGTIFRITASGKLTTLYRFCSQVGCTDGGTPYMQGLAQDTNGTLYGTTYNGGANGPGTVYSLSVGLGPFVKTQTISGKVGAAVNTLGTTLAGATSVTFNGTAASFTVVSGSLITTTVPAGATTGTVQVVTPSGTLSSNVPFRVP
jgi:uncharacterized repeat protein (TIGR03803 family)